MSYGFICSHTFRKTSSTVMALMSCFGSLLSDLKPLLSGSTAATQRLLPYGATLAGLDRPNIKTTGMPKTAAMCPGPVSLLITSLAAFIRAVSSQRFVRPARFVRRTLVFLCRLSTTLFSALVPWRQLKSRTSMRFYQPERRIVRLANIYHCAQSLVQKPHNCRG